MSLTSLIRTQSIPAEESDISENRSMDSSPRPEPPRRRTISPAQKLAYLQGYEQAIQTNEGGAYLRSNGLYSSQIAEWRKLRDAEILTEHATSMSGSSKTKGVRSSKLSKEQAEIARLKKQLAASEAKLATTQTALDIMGKAHALLEQISKSADSE